MPKKIYWHASHVSDWQGCLSECPGWRKLSSYSSIMSMNVTGILWSSSGTQPVWSYTLLFMHVLGNQCRSWIISIWPTEPSLYLEWVFLRLFCSMRCLQCWSKSEKIVNVQQMCLNKQMKQIIAYIPLYLQVFIHFVCRHILWFVLFSLARWCKDKDNVLSLNTQVTGILVSCRCALNLCQVNEEMD